MFQVGEVIAQFPVFMCRCVQESLARSFQHFVRFIEAREKVTKVNAAPLNSLSLQHFYNRTLSLIIQTRSVVFSPINLSLFYHETNPHAYRRLVEKRDSKIIKTSRAISDFKLGGFDCNQFLS